MKLTKQLTLPDDVVTRTLAILAQKGAGKTYTALKLMELISKSVDRSVRAPLHAAVPKPATAPVISHKPVEVSGKLSKAERAILTVLAQNQGGPCTKRKVACIAGYAITGGGFNNAISSLRTKALITGGDPWSITQTGVEALGHFEPLPEGVEAIEFWIRELSKAEGAILQTLLDAQIRGESSLTKHEIAERTGYEASGGGFNNALSALRTRELISGRDPIELLIP